MKDSDTAAPRPAFLVPSLVRKTTKSTIQKSHDFNRRTKSRLTSLSTASSIPFDSYQIVPISSPWTNPAYHPSSPIISLINRNLTSTHQPSSTGIVAAMMPLPVHQQASEMPVYSPYTAFAAPRVTTTLIPLNVGPTDYCQSVKASATPVSLIDKGSKDAGKVATHLIGDWVIRESSEPFRRKENHPSTPSIERVPRQAKTVVSAAASASSLSPSNPVNQWNTDDVCAFFERVLGKSCYAPIIKEHLIDGIALLLLQEEHLVSIFKMQLGPRLKLLNRIGKLKTGELSA